MTVIAEAPRNGQHQGFQLPHVEIPRVDHIGIPPALKRIFTLGDNGGNGNWDHVRRSKPELEDPRQTSYEILTEGEYAGQRRELADTVERSGINFDAVLMPYRGAVLPGEVIAQRLGIPIIAFGVKSYSEASSDNRMLQMYADYSGKPQPNAKYLYIDEVNDTGDTSKFTQQDLEQRFGVDPENILVATVYEKNQTRRPSDFVVKRIPASTWVVYPPENVRRPLNIGRTFASNIPPQMQWYRTHEFFEEWLPGVMIGLDGEMKTWSAAMIKARKIGFKGSELPNPRDRDFQERLGARLERRHQTIFRTEDGIPSQKIEYLMS